MDCQHQQVAATNIAAPPVSIHVMVVDDDATSLAVVSGLLRTLNYEVTSFNDPFRALYTLRAGKQSFDLIMIDLYMPKMDGFEMTKRVIDEFKLPVIMISTDDRESVIFRAIQEGVALYLLKPFTLNDLRNIWQFVISTNLRSKPNPNLFIDETRSHEAEFPVLEAYSREANSVSSSNEVRQEKKKKGSKENGENQEKANDRRELTTATKKAKVVWTDFLQYRFLQAVHYIGLDRAVPKKILQVMNVPGLTRENVASHLQKYRIFLRKVAERCMITSDKTTEEILWSKFLSRHASLILQKIQREGTFQSIEAARNRHLSFAQSPGSFETKQEIKMEKRKYYQTVPSYQKSSNDNNSGHQPTKGWSSFLRNLPPASQGHTARFIGGAAAFKTQNKAQVCNFDAPETHPRNSDEAQFQNLVFFEDSYLSSSFPGSHNYAGFSVGAGRELSLAQKGFSNGCENGFEGNYMGFEAIQRDEYGQYGIGVGGDNSYNWSLMCNNGVNYGGNSQTVSHSSHSLDNKDGAQEDSYCFASLLPLESFVHNPTPNQEQGSESHQLYNIYAADEETPTTDPFSIDDQVLDEFLASLLRNDTSAEG